MKPQPASRTIVNFPAGSIPMELLCRAFRRLDNDGQCHLMGAFRSLLNPQADFVLEKLLDEVFSRPGHMWFSRENCMECVEQLCESDYFQSLDHE